MSGTEDAARPFLELEDIDDFFESAALSLHWVAADGTIVRANAFELEFLGYAREEYEGRHIAEFHVDQDVIDDILARLSRGETLQDFPARMRAKDGSIKHVLINSNVRWLDGEFVHTRCFTRDVTDRIVMEEELERLNLELEQTVARRTAELQEANRRLQELVDMKDRFVAMVSHELRTPLTSISGFSATMERLWEALPDGEKREFVEIIGRQSERLTRLVNDLLTVSRLASGSFALQRERLPLRAAVAATLDGLAAADVEVDVPEDLAVVADATYLQQILVNYVSNALKYGRTRISVRAAPADGSVEVRVADAGPGVPEHFRDSLFEEWAHYGGDDTSKPQPGIGLGLSIVRQLALAHGGDAWYEPNVPRGAVFSVRLPRA